MDIINNQAAVTSGALQQQFNAIHPFLTPSDNLTPTESLLYSFYVGAGVLLSLISGPDVVGADHRDAAMFVTDLTAEIERNLPLKLQAKLPPLREVNCELLME